MQEAMKAQAAIYAPKQALPFLKFVNPKQHARVANLFALKEAAAPAPAPAPVLPPVRNPRVRVANVLQAAKVHKGSGSKATRKAKSKKTRRTRRHY
jgi:hypothetical protein